MSINAGSGRGDVGQHREVERDGRPPALGRSRTENQASSVRLRARISVCISVSASGVR